MEEKLKAAYHEAGHCYRMWDYHSIAVIRVCLKKLPGPGDRWEGDLTYKKSWFPKEGLRLVGLAGLLAEAKARASEGQEVPRNVTVDEDLVSAILHLITDELPNAAGPPGWEVPVPIVGHDDQVANISRADLLHIPEEDRTEGTITGALGVTCDFVNDPANWQAISALAFELDRLGPKCFGSYRLFMIFDEAIKEMRLEEDED